MRASWELAFFWGRGLLSLGRPPAAISVSSVTSSPPVSLLPLHSVFILKYPPTSPRVQWAGSRSRVPGHGFGSDPPLVVKPLWVLNVNRNTGCHVPHSILGKPRMGAVQARRRRAGWASPLPSFLTDRQSPRHRNVRDTQFTPSGITGAHPCGQ